MSVPEKSELRVAMDRDLLSALTLTLDEVADQIGLAAATIRNRRVSSGSWSPVDKPGRSAATLARIAAGRRRFGDRFVAPYYGSGSGETGRSIDRPIGTLTTRARWAVIDGERMRMVLAVEGRELMGFPASYRMPANEAQAWHLTGNAVVPQLAADLIDAVRRAA